MQVATLFLTTIVKSKRHIPYGMLYMTRVLHRALRAKFPDAPEKEILKVIGNLLYYRYINGAVVAPDSCDIVDMNSPEQALNNEQRKNLVSNSKLAVGREIPHRICQLLAFSKLFPPFSTGLHSEASAVRRLQEGLRGGVRAPHVLKPGTTTVAPPKMQTFLHLLTFFSDQYIIEAHERFKEFFSDCCDVRELEDEFDVDQFSEATLIAKPVIYVTLAEIVDTHQLLLDHRFQVAQGRAEKEFISKRNCSKSQG